MIRIAISVEAFDAIPSTLPLGLVSYEVEANDPTVRHVWLEEGWVNRLGAIRSGRELRSAPVVKIKGLVPYIRHGGGSHPKTRRERRFIASPVRSALA
jgi:hypothetical protein